METLWSIRRPVGELRPGDHCWLAYGSPEERSHVVGAFTRAGLDSGEKVVHAPGRTVPAGRNGSGLAPEALLTWVKDATAQAMRQGHRGVRIVADLSWALDHPQGLESLSEFERGLDLLVGESAQVIAVCQVDRRRCGPADLDALGALHGGAVAADPEFEDDVLRIDRTFHPPGLAFTGELDAFRHSALVRVLGTARAHAKDGELHLDMSGLVFMDLGALNILADTAARPLHDRAIVLDRMPPHLRGIMDAVGWHMLPGVRLGA